MADSSMDIVSKVDRQEADNALSQAAKELATRFDFKGTDTVIEWKGELGIEITSSTEDRAKAALDVFKEKLIYAYSEIGTHVQNRFLSPYTLSALPTGGQYLFFLKRPTGYAASSRV